MQAYSSRSEKNSVDKIFALIFALMKNSGSFFGYVFLHFKNYQ
jgi:hypothetical protein